MSKRRQAKAKNERAPNTALHEKRSSQDLRSRFCSPGVLLVLIPSVLYLLFALDRVWVTEDAFITFRSVETFWHGGGPNFNSGMRVESFSHPLWFLILLVLRIGGQEMLAPLAAYLGICLAVGGLACALLAAHLRTRGLSHRFPVGGLIVFSLSPFWDFASSGLETGLTFCWIGATTLLLTSVSNQRKKPSLEGLVLIGIGPLIRLDLLVIAAPLLYVAISSVRREFATSGAVVKAVGISTLPAAAWQVFRMGYYGLVVPTTYLAKEGFESRWGQGMLYLLDTYSLYLLFPLLLIGLILLCGTLLRDSNRSEVAGGERGIPMALIIGGALHTLLVCKAGGDFMHARLLLPGLFAFASATAIVSLPSNRIIAGMCRGVFVLWSVWAVLIARPSYGDNISSDGIADERQWYIARGRISRPVTLDDYSFHSFHRIGLGLGALAHQTRTKAFYWAHIGIAVATLPLDVVVIDPLTLNDFIGSHVALPTRGRPGHEKVARAAWFTARYPPGSGTVIRTQLNGVFNQRESEETVQAAKTFLASPVMREIGEATTAPMTPGLFMKNISRAWRLTHFRFPNDPVEALQTLPQRE